MSTPLEKPGITTSQDDEPMFSDIEIGEKGFTLILEDGRRSYAPYEWYPTLRDATHQQRLKWTPFGDNGAIWWPELDEHLSVASIVRGKPSYAYLKSENAPR